jgi:hypothetical protein
MTFENAMFLAGGALGLAGLLLGRPSREVEPDPRPGLRDWLPAFAAVLLAIVVFRRGVVFLVGPDDYSRLFLSLQWARDPYFATHDHVWLAGHFWVLGAFQALLRDLSLVVTVTSLAGIVLTTFLAARLAWCVSGSRPASLVVAVIVGTQWQMLWASATPMSEVFFLPAVLGTLAAWVQGWQSRGDPARADRLFLQASAWCAAGTLFRYEGWYLAALVGAFLATRAATAFVRPEPSRTPWRPLAGAVLVAAFPCAWVASSRIHLGSWTGFLDQARAITFGGEEQASLLAAFLKYPRILVEDHRAWLLLPLAGAAMAFLKSGRRARPLIAALAALALLSMVLSIHGGIGVFNRPRLTLFVLLPLLALAALPLGSLLRAARPVARVAVASFVLFSVVVSTAKARTWYPHAWGAPADVLALMTRLERERDVGRNPQDTLVRGPRQDLLVFHQGRPTHYFMALYHSGHPDRVKPIDNEALLDAVLRGGAAGAHVLVRKPRPVPVPARAGLLLDLPEYELWELR